MLYTPLRRHYKVVLGQVTALHTKGACIASLLRAPKPSHFARERQIKRNPPLVKSVSPHQRVKEFTNENLTVSRRKLFCKGCREDVGLKATVIKLHFKSKKHQLGKDRLQERNREEIDIAQAFDTYNQEEHLVGETLFSDLQVYRIKVVKTFLRAGVPLNKVDIFCDIRKFCIGQPSHIPLQWKQHAESCVQPGFDYFCSRFHGELGGTLAAFKAARLLSPHKIGELQPETSAVDSLKSFPFLRNDDLLSSMKSELPMYLSAAADVATSVDPLLWWETNWASAVRQVFLILPSSAEAEHAFSILSNCFEDTQESALQDYIEASLMLQYNGR